VGTTTFGDKGEVSASRGDDSIGGLSSHKKASGGRENENPKGRKDGRKIGQPNAKNPKLLGNNMAEGVHRQKRL